MKKRIIEFILFFVRSWRLFFFWFGIFFIFVRDTWGSFDSADVAVNLHSDVFLLGGLTLLVLQSIVDAFFPLCDRCKELFKEKQDP